MFDFSLSELTVIAVVALVVVGPERLPRVARMLGTLYGRAQGYMKELRTEVDRHIQLDELKKIRADFADEMAQTQLDINSIANPVEAVERESFDSLDWIDPRYQPQRKNWRVRQQAKPLWFKRSTKQKQFILSGSARVKRYRPIQSKTRFL